MNSVDDARYRLTLAQGQLADAEQDLEQSRWHTCVADAQMAVENAGKAIVACFAPVEKTHEPAEQIKALLEEELVPNSVRDVIVNALPALTALGWEVHIRATYGDETTFTPPWELYDQTEAEGALDAARQAIAVAHQVLEVMFRPPEEEDQPGASTETRAEKE